MLKLSVEAGLLVPAIQALQDEVMHCYQEIQVGLAT
jgi:hypothetical protein